MQTRPIPTDAPVRKVRAPSGFDVWLVGGDEERVVDVYHAFLRLSWTQVIGTIAGSYLLVNFVFAGLYLVVGGVAHARPGSLLDAFFFSIQTMGTIGYGSMYPETMSANLVVSLESIVALIVTAVSTGLLFARFTRITSRIVFTSQAVVSLMEGVPTLSFRLGNERRNTVLDARIAVTLSRHETTREGTNYYRSYDLKLARERTFALTRTWTVFHVITPDSPLYGSTPESNEANEVDISVFVQGTDDTTHQPVFAYRGYEAKDIRYGMRHADVLSTAPDGLLMLDLREFDRLEAAPTAAPS